MSYTAAQNRNQLFTWLGPHFFNISAELKTKARIIID
jgi:hypothetical protein